MCHLLPRNQTMWNTSIGWRMVNRALPKDWTISNGEPAAKLATICGISREEQDAFVLRSHQLAAEAWAAGVYAGEIVQVPGAKLARDEGIRDDTTLEKLSGLRALFAVDGTVTAGNSSSINDGHPPCSSALRARSTSNPSLASPAAACSATTLTCSASPRRSRPPCPGPSWPHLGGRRPRRAERGVRVAVAGMTCRVARLRS